MPEPVIVDAVRTPIGRAFKGSLAQLRPDEMGAFVVDALLERNEEVDPKLIEEVYCGVGLPQGSRASTWVASSRCCRSGCRSRRTGRRSRATAPRAWNRSARPRTR